MDYNNQQDVELAPRGSVLVGGIVLDVSNKDGTTMKKEANNQHQQDVELAPRDFIGAPTANRSLVILNGLYTVMLIVMFVVLRLLAKNSSDDFVSLANGIAIVSLLYILEVIVAFVSLVITVKRWSELSAATKVIGLYPTVGTIALVAVVSVLISIDKNGQVGIEAPPCNNSAGTCPTNKD